MIDEITSNFADFLFASSRLNRTRARPWLQIMVFFFTTRLDDADPNSRTATLPLSVRPLPLLRRVGCLRAAQYLMYMGKDKFENEDLIKYGWPEDVWYASPCLHLRNDAPTNDLPLVSIAQVSRE